MATVTGVDAKLLKSTKFPLEFNQKVDMKKVNLQVMKKWIAGRITEVLGSEDDVVAELCFGLIESDRFPDIKSLQIQLTGFLEKDTPAFCKQLWKLCLSAQDSPQGVPKELLEAKKLELLQEKMEADKAAEEARKRREEAERRERMGRSGRGGGRFDSWRGDRHEQDRRSGGGFCRPRGGGRSRSPRLRDRIRSAPREGCHDTYAPRDNVRSRRDRGGGRRDNRRARSPIRSPSVNGRSCRSRSPSWSRHSDSDSERCGSPSAVPRGRRGQNRAVHRGERGRKRRRENRGRRRSSLSDGDSPSPKRRRRSVISRSRSAGRRARNSRSRSSSRSSRYSRSPSEGRSRNLSRSPPRRSRGGRGAARRSVRYRSRRYSRSSPSSPKKTRRDRHGRRDRSSSSGYSRSRSWGPHGGDPQNRRRNSSSPPTSSLRRQSADIRGNDGRP